IRVIARIKFFEGCRDLLLRVLAALRHFAGWRRAADRLDKIRRAHWRGGERRRKHGPVVACAIRMNAAGANYLLALRLESHPAIWSGLRILVIVGHMPKRAENASSRRQQQIVVIAAAARLDVRPWRRIKLEVGAQIRETDSAAVARININDK